MEATLPRPRRFVDRLNEMVVFFLLSYVEIIGIFPETDRALAVSTHSNTVVPGRILLTDLIRQFCPGTRIEGFRMLGAAKERILDKYRSSREDFGGVFRSLSVPCSVPWFQGGFRASTVVPGRVVPWFQGGNTVVPGRFFRGYTVVPGRKYRGSREVFSPQTLSHPHFCYLYL